jgi:hypothetical protein
MSNQEPKSAMTINLISPRSGPVLNGVADHGMSDIRFAADSGAKANTARSHRETSHATAASTTSASLPGRFEIPV